MDVFRGWLAIALVQQLGMVVQLSLDSESLQRAFLHSTTTRKAIRPYATLFFVLGLQQLLLKAALQIDFQNRALHLMNALFALVFMVFVLLETFLYEHFQVSTATGTQISFSGEPRNQSCPLHPSAITILFTAWFWHSLRPPTEPVEEHRPRRLIAKHFMESQVSDLATQPGSSREHKKTK